jgi:hypothetical protein
MENNEKESIGQLIDEETERRLDIMGSPAYEFPARIGTIDIVLIIAGILVSMFLIVLCMTGVIA